MLFLGLCGGVGRFKMERHEGMGEVACVVSIRQGSMRWIIDTVSLCTFRNIFSMTIILVYTTV